MLQLVCSLKNYMLCATSLYSIVAIVFYVNLILTVVGLQQTHPTENLFLKSYMGNNGLCYNAAGLLVEQQNSAGVEECNDTVNRQGGHRNHRRDCRRAYFQWVYNAKNYPVTELKGYTTEDTFDQTCGKVCEKSMQDVFTEILYKTNTQKVTYCQAEGGACMTLQLAKQMFGDLTPGYCNCVVVLAIMRFHGRKEFGQSEDCTFDGYPEQRHKIWKCDLCRVRDDLLAQVNLIKDPEKKRRYGLPWTYSMDPIEDEGDVSCRSNDDACQCNELGKPKDESRCPDLTN